MKPDKEIFYKLACFYKAKTKMYINMLTNVMAVEVSQITNKPEDPYMLNLMIDKEDKRILDILAIGCRELGFYDGEKRIEEEISKHQDYSDNAWISEYTKFSDNHDYDFLSDIIADSIIYNKERNE